MRITDISLLDILQKYLKIDTFHREGVSNRYKSVCPFHKDSNPSLTVFDKTSEGKGWDYHCFACGAHGTAPTALVSAGIADTEERAIDLISQDFSLELPDVVTLAAFCEHKGLDVAHAALQGWKDVTGGMAIPFYNQRGDLVTTKVRTKFFGKGKYYYQNEKGTHADAIPYGLHWLDGYDTSTLYIAEGETDCMTIKQAGYQAIGFVGSNNFQPSYAAYLEKFDNLVVVRDNDEAGWHLVTDIARSFPDNVYILDLPKGVSDINNYHIYRCNSDIQTFKALFDTMALLPATPSSFIKAVKEGSISPVETKCWEMVMRYHKRKPDLLYYIEQFSRETKTTKTIINAVLKGVSRPEQEDRKDSREFIIADGRYYKLVPRGDAMVQEAITNFTMTPEYDIQSDGEIIRVVTLTNMYGREVSGVRFDAEALSSSMKFNQTCLSVGDYIFTGTQEDLFQMCVTIFECPKRTVYSPKRIGRLDDTTWLFGNCGIDSSGTVVDMHEDLVFLNDKHYAPRAISIDDGSGESGNSSDLPYFDLASAHLADDVALGKCAVALQQTFGNYGVWLGLGWVVAGWFSNEIFARHDFFPYPFVTGKRSSGKSVLCTMLQSSFGFAASQAGMSIETPTNVGIMRYLSYRSSLPQWYDDYRNDVKRITQKDGLLLDVYNRHGSVKGTRSGDTVRKGSVNGFLLLSGEDTPSNNALHTRCVTVALSAYERDATKFAEAQALMKLMPLFGLGWACRTVLGETPLDEIAACTDEIFKRTGDARYSQNHGIFMGAFIWAFKDVVPASMLDEFKEFVYSGSEKAVSSMSDSHPMSQFIQDLREMGEVGVLQSGVHYKVIGNTLALRLPFCHKVWSDYYRGTAPLSVKSLRGYLEKEPFYDKYDRVAFDDGRARCDILKLGTMESEFTDTVDYFAGQLIKPEY